MSTLHPRSLERPEDRDAAHRIFLILAGVFIASLVACNLIFRKFFIWQPFGTDGWLTFEQSVGLLPYPLTFVITDVISEVYGRKKRTSSFRPVWWRVCSRWCLCGSARLRPLPLGHR